MRIRITEDTYTIPLTNQRREARAVPRWALALRIRQSVRTNIRRRRAGIVRRGYIAWSWRRQAMLRQDQQRRIVRKMRRLLCH